MSVYTLKDFLIGYVEGVYSTNSCDRKKAYVTLEDALQRSEEVAGSVRPFPCNKCSAWHIGHRSSKISLRAAIDYLYLKVSWTIPQLLERYGAEHLLAHTELQRSEQ